MIKIKSFLIELNKSLSDLVMNINNEIGASLKNTDSKKHSAHIQSKLFILLTPLEINSYLEELINLDKNLELFNQQVLQQA